MIKGWNYWNAEQSRVRKIEKEVIDHLAWTEGRKDKIINLKLNQNTWRCNNTFS